MKKISIVDPTIAEAMAICWALQIAKDESFHFIIVKSDAKLCIDAINGGAKDC